MPFSKQVEIVNRRIGLRWCWCNFISLLLVGIVLQGRMEATGQKVSGLAGSAKDGMPKFSIPYHASVQLYNPKSDDYQHICCGSIISKRYVLSAAHCYWQLDSAKRDRLNVAVGSNILNLLSNAGKRHRVVRVIVHEFFVPLQGYDVALLEMANAFNIDGKNIATIAIKSDSRLEPGQVGFLSGWAKPGKDLNLGGVGGQHLHLVSFRGITYEKCYQLGFNYLTKKDACAINLFSEGACDGDSGGPLVDSSMKRQLGLLSYGRKPCSKRHLYVFTSISSVADWIRKNSDL